MFGTLALVLLMCLLFPQSAFAWGPAMHVGMGTSILDNLGLLPSSLAVLLAKHSFDYLYGNIAADIVFAKRLSRIKQFCHHWSTAFRLLEDAPTDSSRAFAYGYLSHLAADTVAHGKYVPRQIALSNTSLNFGHFLWELRADATEPLQSRELLVQVLRKRHEGLHAVLSDHLIGTFLSYDLNRMLFHHINALTVRSSFRRGVGIWNDCSRWYLSPQLVEGYRSECIDRIRAILTDGSRSVLLREDPNGTSALMLVSVRKREFRRLKRRGIPVQPHIIESSRAWAPQAFSPTTLDADRREALSGV